MTLIKGGKVFTNGGDILDREFVLIEKGRIMEVGQEDGNGATGNHEA